MKKTLLLLALTFTLLSCEDNCQDLKETIYFEYEPLIEQATINEDYRQAERLLIERDTALQNACD